MKMFTTKLKILCNGKIRPEILPVGVKIVWRSLLELVMPDICRVCGKAVGKSGEQEGICSDCMGRITFLGDSGCRRCGVVYPVSLSGGHVCGKCLKKEPAFDRARAACAYEEPVRTLLHRLKYASDTCVLPALATIVNHSELANLTQFDWIIPVPLHATRLKSRGLNQAVYLARLFCSGQQERINPFLLERHRETASQTGLDSREEGKPSWSIFNTISRTY